MVRVKRACVLGRVGLFVDHHAHQRKLGAAYEFQEAGVVRDDEINKITYANACRFYGWDPFAHVPREQATVGALRSAASDVDVTRMPKEEWRKRNEAAGIGVVAGV